MNTPPLHLLVGSDANYFEGLRVAVGSTLRFLDSRCDCHVHVMDCGLSSGQIETLRADFEAYKQQRKSNIRLSFVEVELSTFSNLPRFHSNSRAAYARILAPELLDADEAIWVDSDCLVLSDLARVRGFVSEDSLVAGVADEFVKSILNDPISARIERPYDTSYINSGLLWMNLKLMRAEGFTDSLLRLMNTNHDTLIYADQGPINAITVGRRSIIPTEYNQLIHETISPEGFLAKLGSGNLHLIGKVKPWLNTVRGDLLIQTYCFYRVMERLQIAPAGSKPGILSRKQSVSQLNFGIWRSRISGNSRKLHRLRSYRDQLKQRKDLFARVDDLLASLFDTV